MSRGAWSCGFPGRCVLTWTSVRFSLASVSAFSTPSGSWEDAALPSRPHRQTRAVCSAAEGRGQWGPWPHTFSFCAHVTGRLLQILVVGGCRVLSQRNNSGASGVAAGWHPLHVSGAGDAGLGTKVSIRPNSPGEPRAFVTTRNSAPWPETREDTPLPSRRVQERGAVTCTRPPVVKVRETVSLRPSGGFGQARLCGGITRKAAPSRAWLPRAAVSKQPTGG